MSAASSFRPARSAAALVAMSLVLAVGLTALAPRAAAEPARPAWQITDVATPTVLQPDSTQALYHVILENVGGAPTEGGYVVRVNIPARFTFLTARMEPSGGCNEEGTGNLVCRGSETVVSGGFVTILVQMRSTGSTGSVASVASVSGGGAAGVASDQARMRLGSEPAAPGLALFSSTATGPGGESVTQAGVHPKFLTTRLLVNNVYEGVQDQQDMKPVDPIKDLAFYLPLGMLGDPAIATPCPVANVEVLFETTHCPESSRVGTILSFLLGQVNADSFDPTHEHRIESVQPEKGYAAEFAFATNNITIVFYASVVHRDGTYMLRVATPGVPKIAQLSGLVATFFGDVKEEGSVDRGAFLTDPTDCGEGEAARKTVVVMNTWQHPYSLKEVEATSGFSGEDLTFPTLQGCELLSFSSTLSAGPDPTTSGDTTAADEPSGYKLDLTAPQAANDFIGLGTPPYRTVDFTFPAGTTLSPGAANGLAACTATGPHGINIEGPESEEIAADGLERPAAGHCPSSSQVGTVSAISPVLPLGRQRLQGHLYLAEPGCGNATPPNPCTPEDAADGTLFPLYLELQEPESGVIVKLAGKAVVNPGTGQVTSVFENTPQFPVSDLTIETNGGPRASLSNAQTCRTANTSGLIAPWSGGLPSTPSGSFTVDWDGEGGACPASDPFGPVLSAGTTDPRAGEYSPFTLTLKREDREQDLSSLTTSLPPGLLAAVSHVAQCPEPQAGQGACPASSRVGSTTVAIGAGPGPLHQAGTAYLTGPYGGAPFGLSVVVPAVAGPFNLGNVIVRVALFIDPHTAQVTAVSGPLPQIIDGVPLRIRTITLTMDAPQFTLNPTSCAPSSVVATVTSTQGARTTISSPFQAQGCAHTAFAPILAASSQAKTSRVHGASLKVKIESEPGQANIHKVDLTIPKQLPSRLSTLQKACTAAQFEANPAGCPEASNIGVAIAHTPLLNAPLVGPGYLVSHGGEAFPQVVFVLQGEGVRIDLIGQTQITKGVTFSRFDTAPDAPFTSFEAVLPEGPHSVLGANLPASAHESLCGQALKMPTIITAQNGTVITQTTHIHALGCSTKLAVLSHRRKGRTVTLTVYVPAAGRLSVSGKGLSTSSKTVSESEDVTVKLHANRRGTFKTTIKFSFAPGKGKRQSDTLHTRG